MAHLPPKLTNDDQPILIANPQLEEKYLLLRGVIPNAEPNFLRRICERYWQNEEQFNLFVKRLIKCRKYPKLIDYEHERKIANTRKNCIANKFSIEFFLKEYPDAVNYFENRNRRAAINSHYNWTEDITFALTFLKNRYRSLYVKTINEKFLENKYDLIETAKALDKIAPEMQLKRCITAFTFISQNIKLFEEISYIRFMTLKKIKIETLFMICQCCFENTIPYADTLSCENNHTFCRDCIRKYCEVKIGEGIFKFQCFECELIFSLQDLQTILEPNMFKRIEHVLQMEEVKAADLEGIEYCPYCDFAMIPADDDLIFKCQNAECKKRSCRLCRKPEHFPVICEEVEEDEEVKIRVEMENKMSEALIRICYKCSKPFLKADGCNKMTCSCGAIMCYVCKQPVTNGYKHFRGDGGDQYDLCPLFSNTDELHKENVLQEVSRLQTEMIGKKEMKINPTFNTEFYYKMN